MSSDKHLLNRILQEVEKLDRRDIESLRWTLNALLGDDWINRMIESREKAVSKN